MKQKSYVNYVKKYELYVPIKSVDFYYIYVIVYLQYHKMKPPPPFVLLHFKLAYRVRPYLSIAYCVPFNNKNIFGICV